jgi:hypothetical protein
VRAQPFELLGTPHLQGDHAGRPLPHRRRAQAEQPEFVQPVHGLSFLG